MKNHYLVILVAVLMVGCKSKQGKTSEVLQSAGASVSSVNSEDAIIDVDVTSEEDVKGLWTGSFDSTEALKKAIKILDKDKAYQNSDGNVIPMNKLPEEAKKLVFKDPLYGNSRLSAPNKLSIIIDEMQDGKVKGKSVCAGNERALTGTYTKEGKQLRFNLSEPGDDQYDGKFEFSVALNSDEIDGKWTPNDPKQETKGFVLSRKDFKYAPEEEDYNWDSEFLGKNISTEYLAEKDVQNQSQNHLRILRNLVYARHGYSFKEKDVRNVFEWNDWYVPVSADIRDQLTHIEKANVSMMKRYEKYAADYYDDFGR